MVFAVNIYGLFNQRMKWNRRVRKLLGEYIRIDYLPYDDSHKFIKIPKPDGGISRNKPSCLENYDLLCNKSNIYKVLSTSGTTGSGFKYPVSQEFLDHLWAIYWKFRFCHGLTEKDWFAYFIGKEMIPVDRLNPPFWIKSYTTRQLLFSQSHLSPDTVELYLKRLFSSKIQCIHAYPSTLSYFCKLIEEQGLVNLAQKCNIKFISVSSESLSFSQKNVIEKVFQCKVVQIYGMTEGVVNIFECEEGSLHVDEYFSQVCFHSVKGINSYDVSGSSYHNNAFPLKDYETGDRVNIENAHDCKCGRTSRTITEIIGRKDDYITLPDGRKIGRLDHIFKEQTNIIESQIHQKDDYSVVCYVVHNEEFNDVDLKKLQLELQQKLGTSISFKIEFVSKINRTASGKLKAVISEI